MAYVQDSEAQPYSRRGTGPRAGFWRRFAALIVDGIVLGLVNLILERLLKGTGSIIALLITIGYYTYLEGGLRGQTAGKAALGIRVISLHGGGPIGYGRGFTRYIGRYVSTIVIFLGYFWMLWDRESQCWHDKFAGSIVVPVADYPPPS